ncbi:hypothetical protein [Singulisphaera sp. PoT]|uniref:hypothetical protein n=1 Tax=Singulisphaera sp. PoT TaxID=3411797 RepID=UPI003BF58AAC
MAKMPHLTSGHLMLAMGVVAVNFAVGRWMDDYDWDEGLILMLLPMGIVIQLAGLRAFTMQGDARAFWLGFLAFAMASLVSLASGAVLGRWWLNNVWTTYIRVVFRALEKVPYLDRTPSTPRKISIICAAVVLPIHFLAGLIGGLSVSRLTRGSRREETPLDPGQPPACAQGKRLSKLI